MKAILEFLDQRCEVKVMRLFLNPLFWAPLLCMWCIDASANKSDHDAATGSRSLSTAVVVDENFEDPFGGYTLQPFNSDNATASIVLADVVGSQGVLFQGTWNIAAGQTEFSSGLVIPTSPTAQSSDLDPSESDGIVSVSYSIDALLNGFIGDDVANLFAVLLIYQLDDQGVVQAFTQTQVQTLIDNLDVERVETKLDRQDFLRAADGALPDFGPEGGPMSFGIQLGALFDDTVFTGNRQGSLRIDNFGVEVEFPDVILRDRFEN
mgnify:CR=1 FL=1